MRLLIITLISICFLSCNDTDVAEQSSPLNVLFILVDDLGYNDLGYMGSEYYETPHIDRLAEKGTIFTQAYAGSRVCSPSRATIMTGQFTARTGITDWIGASGGEKWRRHNRHDKLLPASYNHHLDHNKMVLPEAMKSAGYRTFFAGKWHLGSEGSYPEDHGFDINIGGYESGSPRGGYFAPYTNPKMEVGPDGENLTMRLADETADFIRSHQDTAFMAFLSFYAVHGPIQTTREKWSKYRQKAVESGVEHPGYKMERVLPYRLYQDNPVYGGLVESMDDAVGKVMNTLEETELLDKTIIIFTSDNGGVVSGDNYSTNLSPLRGGKGYQWEGGIRVPLIIYYPDTENGQKINKIETPVSGADLYPTILEMTDIDVDIMHVMDGQSIWPLMQGKEITKRPMIWHYPHYGNQGGNPSSIIRIGNWKMVWYYETEMAELFDLSNDLSEGTNVADDHPDKVNAMKNQLMDYLMEMNAQFPVPDPEFNPAERAEWEKNVQTRRMANLEQLRKDRLSEDYQPNENWWGSQL